MLSVAPDRPVAAIALDVLTLMDRVAREFALDYFVTGAMARELVLYHVFGLETGRATLDVDLAVAFDSWSEFEEVKTYLFETGMVTPDKNRPPRPHRLHYGASADAREYPFDLLPFGGLEQRPGKIAWPPDLSVVMNVAGYREALAAADPVELRPGLVVRVASLPSLAVLKLVAWNDRGLEDSRDARDFAILLRSYHEAGNEDRLYGDEIALLEAVGYDVDRAGARLLGKDAARIIAPPTRTQIAALLNDSSRCERLAKDMARAVRPAEDPIAEAEASIAEFKIGLGT
jgi:predicted nucleotidyltransferase